MMDGQCNRSDNAGADTNFNLRYFSENFPPITREHSLLANISIHVISYSINIASQTANKTSVLFSDVRNGKSWSWMRQIIENRTGNWSSDIPRDDSRRGRLILNFIFAMCNVLTRLNQSLDYMTQYICTNFHLFGSSRADRSAAEERKN